MRAEQAPAELGDAIGYTAVVIVVIVVLAIGFLSLIESRDRRQPGDSFADGFVSENADVDAIEDDHPIDMPRRPKALGRKGWNPDMRDHAHGRRSGR